MMNNKKNKTGLALWCGIALLGSAAAVQATPVTVSALSTFEDRGTLSEPDSDLFAIRNDSDAGIQISSITIDLSGTLNDAVFDTFDGFTDPDYDHGDGIGYPIEGLNPDVVGMVDVSVGQQESWDEASSITLDFTDFDSGELFLFTTDLDDRIDWRVFGFEMAGATFSVTFTGDALTSPVTLSAQYYNNTDTDIYTDALAQAAAGMTIPEPGTLALFGIGLLGLCARRRS